MSRANRPLSMWTRVARAATSCRYTIDAAIATIETALTIWSRPMGLLCAGYHPRTYERRHREDGIPGPENHLCLGPGHDDRVVRLLYFRKPGRRHVGADVSRGKSDVGADQDLGAVRHGLHRAAVRRAGVRARGRPD